ncbi:hypothetical protein E1176_05285, partial [Fulvivirga sp. RKSG066]|uniref:hypothetical protein n=1 Tax=Fulvivirga aurantia TaxID=2529383 RepID=UPI0012BC4023
MVYRLLLFFSIYLIALPTFADDPDRLEVIKLRDNNKCDESLPDNGSARAYIVDDEGDIEDDDEDYTFTWYVGDPPSGAPVFVGSTFTQMAEGTYTVIVENDENKNDEDYFTDTVTVVINRTNIGPTINLHQKKDVKDCKKNDGEIEVRVSYDFGGGHTHDNIQDCRHNVCFTFVWFKTSDIGGDTIAIGNEAKGLSADSYTVIVTDDNSGCTNTLTEVVEQESEIPTVQANIVSEITDCSDLNGGEITAFVAGENSNKYEFNWYIGSSVKPSPDYGNQETITNLTAGQYTVTAERKSTKCISDPLTVTINDLTTNPSVNITIDNEQTSCDAGNPNGTLSATADGGTAGHTFEWFDGQNTLPANSLGFGATITGLDAGFYTVVATDNSDNCSAEEEIEITDNLTSPTSINTFTVDQTDCTPANGEVSADVGGATA